MTDWSTYTVRPDVVVRVVREMPALAPGIEAQVAAHWAEATARHTLFNGRVFSVDHVTPAEIAGHWTEYRRSVAQMLDPALRDALGVRNLAVCGVICGPDGVLLGRRAANAVYQPGMWQLPPAGSVDAGAATPGGADLRRALMAELAEELGLQAGAVHGFHPLCLVEHPDSGVTDLGIALRTKLDFSVLQAAHAATGNAEYDRLIAVPLHRWDEAAKELGEALVPPARAFVAALRAMP